MKSIIVFLFLLGIIFIIIGQQKCEVLPPRVEYRYIPQTFNDEQYMRVPISAVYGKLFTNASPWENSIGYPNVFFNKTEAPYTPII